MKFTIPEGHTTTEFGALAPVPLSRAERRARRRFDRAYRFFGRAEHAVESALARVHAAEVAMTVVLEHPEVADVPVGNVVVPRTAVPEVLATAQFDLKVASRRQTDAATHVRRCWLALSSLSDPSVAPTV